MKTFAAVLLLALAAASPARGQDLDAERRRIRDERAQANATFQAEQKACYGRFAVNDCLQAARLQRNAAVADLRRQEVVLNDTERKRRAAERLREADARQAEQRERERDAALRGERSEAPREPREPRAARPPRARSDAPVEKVAPQGTPRAARAFEGPQLTAAEAARNQQEFEARRKAAQAHKAAVLERNAKRDKPRSPDLPPP
ncbi:MAG TPA: hypothetical protein VIL30_22825 [Ramlibacter sp.]|jgi:hypothetical protein